MAIIGYARVSSVGQSLDIQETQLAEAGCEKVFSEKVTGTTTKGRDALAAAKIDVPIISLAKELGPNISRCAPAHALAVLAREI